MIIHFCLIQLSTYHLVQCPEQIVDSQMINNEWIKMYCIAVIHQYSWITDYTCFNMACLKNNYFRTLVLIPPQLKKWLFLVLLKIIYMTPSTKWFLYSLLTLNLYNTTFFIRLSGFNNEENSQSNNCLNSLN